MDRTVKKATEPILKKGTRIRFLKTLDEGPDDYAPGRHFCSKGELGTIKVHHEEWQRFEFSVYADSWKKASFFANRDEFELVE